MAAHPGVWRCGAQGSTRSTIVRETERELRRTQWCMTYRRSGSGGWPPTAPCDPPVKLRHRRQIATALVNHCSNHTDVHLLRGVEITRSHSLRPKPPWHDDGRQGFPQVHGGANRDGCYDTNLGCGWGERQHHARYLYAQREGIRRDFPTDRAQVVAPLR
jgi:hypothetical protein